MRSADTIYALSSGSPPSGIAVVRLSGKQTDDIVRAMIDSLPEPREMKWAPIRKRDGSTIDQGLVVRFPGPASFTGEDSAELHVHGSRAVVHALFNQLAGFPNTRLAEPGEFALRAFRNGKIDLTEAEGLADLIAAQTEAQRRLALDQSSGALHALYLGWRESLLQARAMIEAELDFADEEDIPATVSDRSTSALADLAGGIEAHAAAFRSAEIIVEGFKVVIAGPPNAGKSTLLNWFAGREAAIVSEEAGTTRDVIDVRLDLDGYLVILSDTAGIRDDAGVVEAEGIRRAKERIASADLVLSLAEPSGEFISAPAGIPCWMVTTKSDMIRHRNEGSGPNHVVSCVTGDGLDQLQRALAAFVADKAGRAGQLMPTRWRHVELLMEAAREIRYGLDVPPRALELRAEHLRLAADRMARITGAIDVEDILGAIFSRFCIGK